MKWLVYSGNSSAWQQQRTRGKSGEQDKKLEQACNEAIQQIKDNGCNSILKKDRMETIYISGVAFCCKKCKIICEQEK